MAGGRRVQGCDQSLVISILTLDVRIRPALYARVSSRSNSVAWTRTGGLEREPLPPLLRTGVFGLLSLVERSFSIRSGRRDRLRLRGLSSGSIWRGSSGGKCHSTMGMRHATRPMNRIKKNTQAATREKMSGKRAIRPLRCMEDVSCQVLEAIRLAYRTPWCLTIPRMVPERTASSRPCPSPSVLH